MRLALFTFSHILTFFHQIGPETFISLTYMLLPWLLLSIVPSICLSSFSNVKTRKKIGTTLKLGALSYDEDDGFLKACRDGHPALVEAILTPPRNSTVLNKSDENGQTGLHLACANDKFRLNQ